MNPPPRIALTPGEPAGIGPDLAVMIASTRASLAPVVIADPSLLSERADILGRHLRIRSVGPGNDKLPVPESNTLDVLPVPRPAATICGEPDPANAEYVLETLRIAADGCMQGRFGAMVTGPVNKAIINEAGIPFTGHTEFLAEYVGGHPVMMLAAPGLRVALVTTHLPLAMVAKTITHKQLTRVARILDGELRSRFGIGVPKILICGLNPHAGEGGHLGSEEIEAISPAIEALRAEGLDLEGPLPADTVFTPDHLRGADAVLAMYHDQGLPVLKYAGFGKAVNVTLGLPLIRTSVDHGTALEIAGTDKADTGSLHAALDLAAVLAGRSQTS